MDLQFIKVQILQIGLLIIAAYLGGKLAKKLKTGEVVGQILGGALVGPNFLKLLFESSPLFATIGSKLPAYSHILETYHFFIFLFLTLIAFSLGEELHRDRVKQMGVGPLFVAVFQALFTGLLLFLGFYYIAGLPLISALILGSIGIATAPGVVFILMQKYRTNGELKKRVASMLVIDDLLEVIFFSLFLGIAVFTTGDARYSYGDVLGRVAVELTLSIALGVAIFLALKMTIRSRPPTRVEEREFGIYFSRLFTEALPSLQIFYVVSAALAIGMALALHLHLPFLIMAISAGVLVANFHFHAIFESLRLNNIFAFFSLLFFAMIGANLNLESFSWEGLKYVGLYIVLRSIGKLLGTTIGCRLVGENPRLSSALPTLMLPQAGMAAVETLIVVATLKDDLGLMIFNTIIPAIVFFEIVGSLLAEKTLMRWRQAESPVTKKAPESDNATIYDLIGGRVIEIASGDKRDVIAQLADLIQREGLVADAATVIEAVLEQEKAMTSAVGGGIAIPHCRLDEVTETAISCALLKVPVEWNAPDNAPVDIVFLTVTPESLPEQYLKAMRTISLTLKSVYFKTNSKNILIKSILREIELSKSTRRSVQRELSLSELIEERVVRLHAASKREVLATLVARFAEFLPLTENIEEALLHDEEMLSSAVGEGIAFPHCRIKSIARTYIYVALLDDPVEWAAFDKKPVDLVFMILTPERLPEQYLKTLQVLSHLLQSVNFRTEIAAALDRGAVLTHIQEMEERC